MSLNTLFDSLLLFSNYTSVPSTVIQKNKVLFSSFDMKRIEDMPMIPIFPEDVKISSEVQFVTYNSMECYGVFRLDDEDSCTVILGPVLTIRPLASENLRYLSFYKLHDEELLRKYVNMIPLFTYASFSRFLELVYHTITGKSKSADKILEDKIPIMGIVEHQDYSKDIDLEYVEDRSVHIYEDFEEYGAVIRSGDLEKLNELFERQLLFSQFTKRNLKQCLTTFISIASFMGKYALEGGLDFYQTSLIGSTMISVAETHTKQAEFIASFKKLMFGYTNQVKEELLKYQFSRPVKKAMKFIDKYIHYPISLDEIAAHVKLSRPYLSQMFSKETGISLQSHIQLRKVAEAESLLKYTKMPISEIASSLSFCSQSYFTEVFRKAKGMTPVQYRKKNSNA